MQYFAEGKYAYERGDCNGALSAFDQVSTAAKTNPQWVLYVAQSHECLQHYQEAIDFYRQYAEIVPGQALFSLTHKVGELSYKKKQSDEQKAIKEFEEDLKRVKETRLIQDNLERIETLKDSLDKSVWVLNTSTFGESETYYDSYGAWGSQTEHGTDVQFFINGNKVLIKQFPEGLLRFGGTWEEVSFWNSDNAIELKAIVVKGTWYQYWPSKKESDDYSGSHARRYRKCFTNKDTKSVLEKLLASFDPPGEATSIWLEIVLADNIFKGDTDYLGLALYPQCQTFTEQKLHVYVSKKP